MLDHLNFFYCTAGTSYSVRIEALLERRKRTVILHHEATMLVLQTQAPGAGPQHRKEGGENERGFDTDTRSHFKPCLLALDSETENEITSSHLFIAAIICNLDYAP